MGDNSLEQNNFSNKEKDDVTVETNSNKSSKGQNNGHDFFDNNYFLFSKTTFKKLSKKYNKNLKHDFSEEEFLDLIQKDLLLKRQNSILVKEYFKTKFVYEIFGLIFAAFCLAIVYDYFVSSTGNTGLFPAGVGSISRFLSIITFSNDQTKITTFFYVYQVILNIPLVIFGIYKVGIKISIYTVLFILFQMAFDQLFSALPYINPSNFSLIVDYKLISKIGGSWNYAIWLFIIAIFGGALMGWTYSIVYRLGATTGGSDFITIYLSNKTSKPIGTINRNFNFCLVSIIIILNVSFLKVTDLNSDIVLSQFKNVNLNDTFINGQTYSQYFSASGNEWSSFTNGATYVWEVLSKAIVDNHSAYESFVKDLPLKFVFLIKVEFILGPSLFASFLLFIMNGIVTNYFYPKYKLRTFMISTNKPKEVHEKIMELGFQNEVAAWDTTNRSRGNYLHRTMFMLSMPVIQWNKAKNDLFLVDPYMKVTIMRTKAVVGLFKYEPVQNSERNEIIEKVNSDQNEIEKIRQIAIVKFKKQMNNANLNRLKLEQQIKSGGEKKKRAEKEIEHLSNKRKEMISRFKENLNNIDNTSESIIMESKKENKEDK